MKPVKMMIVMAILALSAGNALAGWKAVDQEGEITLLADGKIKSVGRDGLHAIIDSRQGIITMINDRQQTFVSGPPKEYCSGIKEMMDAMMAEVPAEQRAMMEGMMEKQAPKATPVVSVNKVGPGGKVAGWDTVRYEVLVDGALFEEVWLATDSRLVGELQKVDLSVLQGFNACVGAPVADGFDPESSPEYIKLLKAGWEVKSVIRDGMEEHVASEVVSLEQVDIPDSEFRVPPDYRQTCVMEIFVTGED